MPFSPICSGCGKAIDDMNSVQVCEDCASKLDESAPSASTNSTMLQCPLHEGGKMCRVFVDKPYRCYINPCSISGAQQQ